MKRKDWGEICCTWEDRAGEEGEEKEDEETEMDLLIKMGTGSSGDLIKKSKDARPFFCM